MLRTLTSQIDTGLSDAECVFCEAAFLLTGGEKKDKLFLCHHQGQIVPCDLSCLMFIQ